MNHAPIPEISCNCGTCGWQFAGTFQQAMSLYQCQSCGAPTLFLMSPVAPHLGIWSTAGEPLDALRQRINLAGQQQNQPAPQFTAPPTISQPPRVPGQAPRAAGRPSPRRRAPHPVPKKSSNTGLFIGLGVGGLAIVFVLVVVLASSGNRTKDSSEVSASSNTAPVEDAYTYNEKHEVKQRPKNLGAIKLFMSDIARLNKELDTSMSKLSSFEDKLTIAADAELAKISEESDSIDGAIGIDESSLASANTNLTKTQKAFRTIGEEIRLLRSEQDPLLAFIGTYTKLSVAYTELDELEQTLDTKRAEEHVTIKALNASVDDVLDCQMGVEFAETATERATTALALADAERRREQREADYFGARDNVADAEKAVSRKESDIIEYISQVEDLYKKLDRQDATTRTLLDAIDEYKKALIKAGRSKAELKRDRSELDKIYRSTDNPYTTVIERKKEYFEAHKTYLAARKQTSVLEKNYLQNGGGAAAKARIRTAKDNESAAKRIEKAAKSNLRDAESLVKSSNTFEKGLLEKAKDSRATLEGSIKEASAVQKTLLDAIKIAKLKAGPNEEARIKSIERLEKKLTKAAKARDTSIDAVDTLERKINKLTRSRNALSTEMAIIEVTRVWLKDGLAKRQIQAISEQIEKMNDVSIIGHRDGERIESSAIDLVALINGISINSETSAAFRLKYSEDVEGWLEAMGEIQSTAYKIQNAGRILVRKLAE